MPTINMENVVANKDNVKLRNNTANSQEKVAQNSNSYIQGIKNLWPFQQDLSEYNLPLKIVWCLLRLIFFILYNVFFIIKSIVLFAVYICQRSKFIKWLLIIAAIVFSIWLIDFICFSGKIYPGIYVGDIDLGNKNVEEAKKLVDENLSYRLTGNNVVIYSSEEAKAQGENAEHNEVIEQLSIDDAKQTVKYWKTNAIELEATLPTEDMINEAYDSFRGISNIFKRLGALFFSYKITPYANYNNDAIKSQINRINDIMGKPVNNPTCVIEEGEARALEGSDGKLIEDDEFLSSLNEAFFMPNPNDSCFVTKLHDKRQNISFNSAKKLAEILNNDLNSSITFSYKNTTWNADKLMLSNWIKFEIDQSENDNNRSGCSCANMNNNNYYIKATIDNNKFGSDIIEKTRSENQTSSDYSIKFYKSSNGVFVNTSGNFEMPSIQDASDTLNKEWLKNAIVYDNTPNDKVPDCENNYNIAIKSTNIPEQLSLNDAINYGVVSKISTYTTTYSSGAGTENRNQNISLAANLINNSICEADGGTWSFNDTAGDCNAEKGFLEAGSIVGNSYTKSIGGGICQVATTVYNAVYDAGLPITVRYNHDLHIASYPAGRDAAINYPDLDLKWQNSESSDILLQARSTGYSIIVDLLGVDPEYQVKSEVGQWSPGDPFKTENVIDPSKEPNSKFKQTSGSDGKSIIVKRTVYNKDGSVKFSEDIKSNYKPLTEIIVYGPGDEANKLLLEHNARMKKEDDNW